MNMTRARVMKTVRALNGEDMKTYLPFIEKSLTYPYNSGANEGETVSEESSCLKRKLQTNS